MAKVKQRAFRVKVKYGGGGQKIVTVKARSKEEAEHKVREWWRRH